MVKEVKTNLSGLSLGDKPKLLREEDWYNISNHLDKWFKDFGRAANMLPSTWFNNPSTSLYKFCFKSGIDKITDYDKAKETLDAFLKSYIGAYDLRIDVDDFALLDILKYPEYGFTLYDIVVSFYDAEYFIRRFINRDILFVEKQREILYKISYFDYVSVRSSVASGKSFTAGHAGFWWVVTHFESKLIVTAPTSRQAINILWSEFKQVYHKFKKRYPKYCEEKFGKDNAPRTISFYQGIWNIEKGFEKWQVLCFSAKEYNPEAIQGFHSKWLFVIADEASGIAEVMFSAFDRILTGSTVSKYLLLSNATKTAGFFYNTQLPDNEVFEKIHITAFNSPNVIMEFLENKHWYAYRLKKRRITIKPLRYKMLGRGEDGKHITIPSFGYVDGLINLKDVLKYLHIYGKDSDNFRIAVLGEFPKGAGEFIVHQDQIEYCRKNPFPEKLTTDVQLAIDPSTGTGDSITAFGYRNGDALLALGESNATSDAQREQDFVEFYSRCPKPDGIELKSVPVMIDRTGVGFGFFDYMKTRGYNVDGFFGHEEPVDFHNKDRYSNRRSESYGTFVEKIKMGVAYLISHPALNLLASISYKQDGKGRIQLEEKRKIKVAERDVHFLDYLDAASMAFAPSTKKGNFSMMVGKFKDELKTLWDDLSGK